MTVSELIEELQKVESSVTVYVDKQDGPRHGTIVGIEKVYIGGYVVIKFVYDWVRPLPVE